MVFWMASGAGLAIAYLFGATPTGYLAGKLLKGIDIREHGSKSIGATNVLRTLGKWPALVVLLVDVLKGAGAIVFARWLYTLPFVPVPAGLDLQTWMPWAVCLAGLAVLLGHGRSIWLNFAGGKSAATGLGVLLAMSWPVGLGAVAVFGVVLAIFRIVSLGSMLAALSAIALVCGLEQPLPYRLLVIAGSLYVIVRHRANIRRLLAGTEPRVSAAWVGAAFTLGTSMPAVAAVLLLVYPGWDAAANLVDAQRNGGLKRNPTQALNVTVSGVATVAVAIALGMSMNAVLGVFGVWAALSGLFQLATAARRWNSYGAQWAMILSGAQSALAGVFFLKQANAPKIPSITDIAPYAAFGAFYFLVSALWLTVSAARRRKVAWNKA
jgi:acyl phosphate:glycerol-3-phosphate acyltransferase